MAERIVQTAGRDALGKFAPAFAHYNDDVLFGENWNDPAIDVKTRSMITVTALMAQGITDSSLKYHIQNAKNHGVTKEEMAGIITHVAFYAGWPKAWAVFNLAKEVYSEPESEASEKDRYRNSIFFPIGEPNPYGQFFIGQSYLAHQEWGRDAVEMKPGTVINIPAGVKHWHGAAADSWFSHLALEIPGENGSNEWLEAVTDEQYSSLR